MNRKTIFALIFCILAVRLSKGKGSYIAVAPKTIRPNTEYAVSVTLPENTVPALAEVSITSPTYNASQTIEFEDYKTSVARFNTPPNLNNGTYTLKVRGLSGVEFFNSTDLIYENGDNALEVVTDQPDETLKNITVKRFGPLKLNFKREVRRVANDRLIKINATEPIKYAVADVMANGKIVKHQYFNIGGEHTTDYITITPTTDMIPKANIFVYYIQNDTLIWRDLTMFFANTSDCENNNTEYHRLLLENDEDNSELTTPTQLPGEQSGLLTLTDANYGTERSIFFVHIYKNLATIPKYVISGISLICKGFSKFGWNSSTDAGRKAVCLSVIILDYNTKKSHLCHFTLSIRFIIKNIHKRVWLRRRTALERKRILKNFDYTIKLNGSFFEPSCSTCERLIEEKQKSLEAIKKNILIQLNLSSPPKITKRPLIPKNILDSFHTQYFLPNQKTSTYDSRRFSPYSFIIPDFNKIYGNCNASHDCHNNNLHSKKTYDIYATKWRNFNQQNVLNREFNTGEEFKNSKKNIPLNGIYIFPKKLHLRHNSAAEILYFPTESATSHFSRVLVHVFIWGNTWISSNESKLLYDKFMTFIFHRRKEIVICFYKVFHHLDSSLHSYKIFESSHRIPLGIGHWVAIELEHLQFYWMKNDNIDHYFVIRGKEAWMRSLFFSNDINKNFNTRTTLYFEVVASDSYRNKRSTSLDCHESDNEIRCCRYPLKINFTNFGWNFIVAPQHFDAYFCNGECNVGYLEKYTHTHITSLTVSAKPCCSPQKLSPLTLLYFDTTMKLMYSTIPNMSVEKCSCS